MHDNLFRRAAPLLRRELIRAGVGLLGAVLGSASFPVSSWAQATPTDTITVTLLGTGSPSPNPNRFSSSTLVQAGGLNMLFDAGRGSSIRLRQLGVRLGSIGPTFITHFHSDHTVGLPDLWMTGYIQTSYAKRSEPMLVIGPTGTKHMADTMRAAFVEDRKIRLADEKVPELATRISARDFKANGVVFEASGVKVTAFAVNHGPLIKPAYGYRVDYAGRSVLITGDTKFDENVIKYGQGVDLLVHEVCAAAPEVLKEFNNQAVMDHHTSAEEAGTVFSRAKPKMAAYTHIIQLTAQGATNEPDVAQIEAATRRTYAGPLVVGDDLTRFVIGDTVTVQRWDVAKQAYPQ